MKNGLTPAEVSNPFQIQQSEPSSCCTPSSGCCSPEDPAGALTRRQFLARTSAASLALLMAGMPRWAAGSGQVVLSPHLIPKDKSLSPGWIKSLTERGTPEEVAGEQARTIGMPVGGIAAGQLYLCGDGSLGLWEIFNEHSVPPHGAESYARRTIPKPVSHGLGVYWKQGDETHARMLDHSGFDIVSFRNTHPIGQVTYESKSTPISVKLEAFSPFIPGNAKDSALPATIMLVTIENHSDETIEVGTASWLENPIARKAINLSLNGQRAGEIVSTDNSGRIIHTVSATPENGNSVRPSITLQDFEGPNFSDWTTEGTAFGDAPTTGNLPQQQNVTGWEGKGFAGSFRNHDQSKGRIISPPFTIQRRFLNFLIAGGKNQKLVGARLLIDGTEVHTASGQDREPFQWHSWNVSKFEGQEAVFEIYDQSREGWGHIQVDHIEQSDAHRPSPAQPAELEKYTDYGTLCWAADKSLLGAREASAMLTQIAPTELKIETESNPAAVSLTTPLTLGIATKPIKLKPRDKAAITHILTWHFPNTIEPDSDAGHYYSTRFPDANAVLDYITDNRDRLITDTLNWRDTYYDSTLPYWLLERMHLTSCCLATGTTMWWENERFWAYEGVICCKGTCTHVYNYVQTVAHLFPELERNIRENQDLKLGVGLEDSGLVGFRHDGKYAADGQCGTVLKVYREHRMSADSEFLKRNWRATRMVLDYAISRDANNGIADGIMEDSQHNTYDADLVGPNTFIGALYLAALRAGEEMAREMNDTGYADRLHELYEKGRAWTESNLWNGEYFKQIVDLKQHDKFQYGDGCLSDQLFGQTWAHLTDLGYLYDDKKVRKALTSIWEYNWAPDLGTYNGTFPPQRLFAEEEEAGLFNCTWPQSAHLDNGILYRDEVWSGVEYQVANHMVYEEMLTEGLAICRAIHDRYHPAKRNPFNEIECSDYYSRAMASWGMLLALSGFQYHGPQGRLKFAPRITPDNFRCAFNTAEGWGSFHQHQTNSSVQWTIMLKHGQLRLYELQLPAFKDRKSYDVKLDNKPLPVTTSHENGQVKLRFTTDLTIRADQKLHISAI